MFPIYQSLYKHLPPFFTHQLQHPGGGGGKIELPNTTGSGPNMVDSNHLFAAAAAAAMEQVAAAHSGNKGTNNLNMFLEHLFSKLFYQNFNLNRVLYALKIFRE